MAAKKLGKRFCCILFVLCLLGPNSRAVVIFPEAVFIGSSFIETNLGFKGFDGLEFAADRNGGNLNNGVTLRVDASGFKVKKDELRVHLVECATEWKAMQLEG